MSHLCEVVLGAQQRVSQMMYGNNKAMSLSKRRPPQCCIFILYFLKCWKCILKQLKLHSLVQSAQNSEYQISNDWGNKLARSLLQPVDVTLYQSWSGTESTVPNGGHVISLITELCTLTLSKWKVASTKIHHVLCRYMSPFIPLLKLTHITDLYRFDLYGLNVQSLLKAAILSFLTHCFVKTCHYQVVWNAVVLQTLLNCGIYVNIIW